MNVSVDAPDRSWHSSRAVTTWLAEPGSGAWRELDGTWVLADVSGFTALTEVLDVRGPDGAEVLHEVLTRCFGAVLARGIELGGDVVGFAGDAALVRFTGAEHERRAAQAALAMPAGVAAIPSSTTGGRRLRVSVGVNTGPMLAVLTRTEQRGLFLCGPAASQLAHLESLAPPGGVVVSDEVAAAIDGRWLGRRLDDGVRLRSTALDLDGSEPATSDPVGVPVLEDAPEPALPMYGPGVRRRLASGSRSGDLRKVSIGFVHVGGLDAELRRGGPDAVVEALEPIAANVVSVTSELSVEWLGTDFGVDGVKLLLAAGAPRSVPDDEERMLVALRRIIDGCRLLTSRSISLRAGAQRGAVFAGDLGVTGRRSYTVLGDPVNVAARALGLASPGEIVVADGLGITHRPHAASSYLGDMELKNRRRPMPMWRLDSIDSPVARRPLMPARTARLVRVDELAAITETWRRAADPTRPDDEGRCASATNAAIAVIGHEGMGVSEVVAEAAALAGDAGTLLVPDPFRRPIPYGLIGELVESLHRSAGSPIPGPDPSAPCAPAGSTVATSWLASFSPRLPTTLRAWVPAAISALGADPLVVDVDPRLAASRTRAALAGLIAHASPRPWLLAVDDLDAVDDSSRSVLAALTALVTTGRGGIAADDDATPMDASLVEHVVVVLGASRAEVVPELAADTIELAPVDDTRARTLVRELAPLLRDDQVDRIVAASGGTPIVLAALTTHADDESLPDSLQRLAAVRLDGLPPATRDLVREASVLGTAWTAAQVAELLGRPELVDRVWWADAWSVVRTAEDGTMSFLHEAVRTAAYSSLTFERRRTLHGVVADELARRSGGSSAALALHLEAAGRFDEALPHAIAAGRSAKATGALVEAADLLERAARLARGRDPAAVPDLLCDLGQSLVWLGDLDRGAVAYRSAALVLAKRRSVTGADRETLRRIGWLAHLQADLALLRGKLDAAAMHVQRGLAAVEPLGDEVATERCRLLLDRAWVHIDRGQQEASLAPAAVALVIAQRVGDAVLEGLAHLNLGVSYGMVMSEAALFHSDGAIRRFEETGQDHLLGPALANSALTATQLGFYDDAIDRYRRAADLAVRYGRVVDRVMFELNIGYVRARRGELVEAGAAASEAERSLDRLGAQRNRPLALSLRGIAAMESGRLAEAEEVFERARQECEELDLHAARVDNEVLLMDVCLRAGRVEEVLRRAAVVRGLDQAESYTSIDFDRVVGTAEAVLDRSFRSHRAGPGGGDRGEPHGQGRLLGALERARSLRLPYEEYQSLGSLLALERLGGPPAPAGTATERAALAERLGIRSDLGPVVVQLA